MGGKKFIITFLLIIISFSVFNSNTFAQKKKDKVRDTFLLRYHSPTKATIMSAIIPGLGQAYNHKYWKIPILYAGAGVIFYFANFNTKWYNYWKGVYAVETQARNSPTYTPSIDPYPNYVNNSLDDFKSIRDYYQKDLQLTYIIAAGVYILNILDAAVDANLFDYDISDKLTLSPSPIYCPSYDKNLNFAMKLTFKF